jgi:FixJ family two-component response regulator/Tfp pilus assembly protein PilZ
MPRSEPPKESHAPSVFASEIEGFTAKSKLSRRESDIVVALIRNITNSEEIAKSLGISTHTVNNHLKSIFEKTSTKSKTEILSTFLRYAADRLQSRSLFVKRPRVLIIDDEEMICDVVASGLAERGMRTHTLKDPSRALEMITKYNIDFVVCDVRMPTMSGMDVLKTVRKTFRHWPYFLFVTGFPDVSLEECMHYGAVGFIEKPIDIELLFRTIMGHLAESGDERAELLAGADAEPVVIDETYRLEESDIGFGGVFIPMETGSQKKSRVGVGSVVDLTLSPAKRAETLKIRGQIVWKRPVKDHGLKAGVGVRFIKMSDRDQSILDSYLKDRDVTSFVPMGGPEAARAAAN